MKRHESVSLQASDDEDGADHFKPIADLSGFMSVDFKLHTCSAHCLTASSPFIVISKFPIFKDKEEVKRASGIVA